MPVSTRIYSGGALPFGGQPAINDLKSAGYSTVILWSVHVAENGDLALNNTYIVSCGRYEEAQPMYLPATVAQLRAAGVEVLFSVGSGYGEDGPFDFRNIARLLNGGVPGPGHRLYDNFDALRRAMRAAGGDINGIDFDNEDYLDASVMANFARMLKNIGYQQVTFCPYGSDTVWEDTLRQLNRDPGGVGFVSAIHLQCYSGGAGNLNPATIQGWQDLIGRAGSAGATVLIPGLATVQAAPGPWWADGARGGNVVVTPNVALDPTADWSKILHILNFPSANAALQGAQQLGGATFFFYCDAPLDLGPGRRFVRGDAVFFAGQPAWRPTAGSTGYSLSNPCSDIWNGGRGACPVDLVRQYRSLASVKPLPQGGFIWLYDSVVDCFLSGTCGMPDPASTAKAYREAIVIGLTSAQ